MWLLEWWRGDGDGERGWVGVGMYVFGLLRGSPVCCGDEDCRWCGCVCGFWKGRRRLRV